LHALVKLINFDAVFPVMQY